MSKNSRVLVIPDLHIPFHHKDSFQFLKEVKKVYKPDRVVLLGDEIDGNQISFHDRDPDIPFSPSSELENAIEYMKVLYKIFPSADIVESNHGSLVYRKGKWCGLPRHVFKGYNEILNAPKEWMWHFDLYITLSNGQRCYFHHGLSKQAVKTSKNKAVNHVCGHFHSEFKIEYWANSENLFWAVNSGCLIDDDSLAFAYNKNTLARPILGCTMIINGIPKLIPMVLNKKNRWTGKI